MSKISKLPSTFIIPLLVFVLLAKLIGVVLFWMLPQSGIELPKHYDFAPDYIRINLAKAMGLEQKSTPKTTSSQTATQMPSTNISSMVLKGLFGNKTKGYAIVAKKSNIDKAVIIGIGEQFEGYTLKSIEADGVIFTKGGKEYLLKMIKPKIDTRTQIHRRKKNTANDNYELYNVKQNDVKYFAKNPREIWKNIAIDEVRKGTHIEGFKVRWIKPGSKFATLGLKKGDIIIKANNKRLRSYRDAINIYKKINTLDEVSIVFIRDGEEKELVYEIDR